VKKLILTALVAIAFISCNDKPYQAINNSDYDVTFVINRNNGSSREYTLKSKASDNYYYELKLKSFSATPPRVYSNNDYETLEFFNIPARQIKIINNIDRVVMLSALGCIDNEPVTIPANSEIEETIFSNSPIFNGVTVDGFPIKHTISLDRQSVILNW